MPIVSGKTLGQRRPLFADWSWPLPAEVSRPEGTPVKTLLDRIVRDQVEAFRQRQQEDQLVRILTARRIDEAGGAGSRWAGVVCSNPLCYGHWGSRGQKHNTGPWPPEALR